MAKNETRRRIEQRILVAIAWWCSVTTRLVPWPVLRTLSDLLAYVAMLISPRRQRLAEANIAASFPDLSPAECRGIRRRSVRNATRTMLELFKLAALTKEQLGRLVVCEGGEPLHQAVAEGSGVLVITGHFGSWELLGAYLSEFVAPVTIVARDEGRGPTERFLNQARRAHCLEVIGRNDARRMLRVLRSGGMLGILPDQHAARGGQLLDFLGRPAWTFTGPAYLAARAGARVFPTFCVRDFAGPFRVEVWPEVVLAHTGDDEADVTENTRRINAAIEQAIRAHPDNWLWLHNRWKEPRPRRGRPPASEETSAASDSSS
jgi:KDO2-lipid IV(A) lauroyltransferase